LVKALGHHWKVVEKNRTGPNWIRVDILPKG